MTIDDLTAALNGLSTTRLQQLANRLARNPEVKVTVGAWRPECPMVLAGYDPQIGSGHGPEERFAKVWDRFASPPSRAWPLPRRERDARRSDVQSLLRATNTVLAARLARGESGRETILDLRSPVVADRRHP